MKKLLLVVVVLAGVSLAQDDEWAIKELQNRGLLSRYISDYRSNTYLMAKMEHLLVAAAKAAVYADREASSAVAPFSGLSNKVKILENDVARLKGAPLPKDTDLTGYVTLKDLEHYARTDSIRRLRADLEDYYQKLRGEIKEPSDTQFRMPDDGWRRKYIGLAATSGMVVLSAVILALTNGGS